MDIILASKSTTRQEILRNLGLNFNVFDSNPKEDFGKLISPSAIVKKISLEKAYIASKKYPASLVIASDTFVVSSNKNFLFKPKNRSDAINTIKSYNNTYCDVYSGLALINRTKSYKKISYDKSRIYFNKISDSDIENYLNKSKYWHSSAGSIAIEEMKNDWIKKIEGDYYTILGLPVNLLKKMLLEIDIFI